MANINNLINIQLKANDKASAAFKRLSNSSKTLSNRLKANSASFKRMGAIGTVAFGGLALGVKKVTSAYEKQLGAEKQVQQGIESTGAIAGKTLEELKKTAADLQKNSIFGDEDILQNASAQILTFTNITGDQFNRVQQASLDLTTRLNGVGATGEQLKSTSIQLGKALNDPIANLSALSRSGIQFSVEQKETIKTLWEAGRAAEAQTLILDELDRQYGGSAKAAADAKGATHQLSKSFGDMLEVLGEGLKPALDELSAAITPIITRFAKFASDNPELIKNIALITAGIAGLLVVLGTLGLVVPVITAGFGALATASSVLGGALMFLAANPIGLLITAVAALGIVIYKMYKNWDDISWAIVDITQKMKQRVLDSWEVITIYAEILGSKVQGLVLKFQAFKDGAIQKLSEFKSSAMAFFSGVKDSAISTMTSMKDAVIGRFQAMVAFVSGALQRAKDTAKEIATLGFAKTETFNGAQNVSGTKANGGPVKGGSAYMVGERGPELFVPDSSGSVIPNGGGAINFTLNMGGVNVNNSADENRLNQTIKDGIIDVLKKYKQGIA